MIRNFETSTTVGLHCTVCGELKVVETKYPRLAYFLINRFRKEHEHLERRIKVNVIHSN